MLQQRSILDSIPGVSTIVNGVGGLIGGGLSDIAGQVWDAISSHMDDLVSQLFGKFFSMLMDKATEIMPAIRMAVDIPNEIQNFVTTALPELLLSLYSNLTTAIADAFIATFAIVGTAANTITAAVDLIDVEVQRVNQMIKLCTSLADTLTRDINAFVDNYARIRVAMLNFAAYLADFTAALTQDFGSEIICGIIQDMTTYASERMHQITNRILTGIKVIDYVDIAVSGALSQPSIGYDFTAATTAIDSCFDRTGLKRTVQSTIQECSNAISSVPRPDEALQLVTNIVDKAELALKKFNASHTYMYVCSVIVILYGLYVFIKCLSSRSRR